MASGLPHLLIAALLGSRNVYCWLWLRSANSFSARSRAGMRWSAKAMEEYARSASLTPARWITLFNSLRSLRG